MIICNLGSNVLLQQHFLVNGDSVRMQADFDNSILKGLTESEASERLQSDGYNELPTTKRRSFLYIVLEVCSEPMFLLLLACGALYFLSGEFAEASMLLSFVFVVMGITLYQERKTERALEALRDLSSPRALVIRSGVKKRIAGREVVRDDILLLSEGDRVPADAELVGATNLSIDESLLTGESVPVRKSASYGDSKQKRPGGDDLPYVFSGTLVVQGQGIAKVLAVGSNTEIGKIGRALEILQPESTSLQKQTAKLVRIFAVIGVILCMVVVVVFALTRHDWMGGFLAGLSLAMAMLPEEFPVVLTVFLALGAWRIGQHKVLTRRVPVVETLGSATVLCVDKTGTLTLNRMTVRELYSEGQYLELAKNNDELPELFHRVVEYSILASPSDPFDPMEKAMRELGIATLSNTEHLHDNYDLLREYPLSKELLAMSRVWHSPDQKLFVVAAKGAPEAIADLCHLKQKDLADLLIAIDEISSRGRRVIGVAAAKVSSEGLPEAQHDFHFKFVGLLGLEDPVRPGVKDAISDCYQAGIRTIMITGDYPGTARNIAQQIGLKNPATCITGPELEAMSNDELALKIRHTNIFARMVPEQKLRLITALKANDEVVAMTGDGVNDAPALKVAHIGIAMGGRGTDVAREAASIVLLEDDFNSLVRGIEMGRRIYDNLKKAMRYIFSIHVPIAGLSLLPVIFKWPLILFPVHIVFLELIIDPVCSVVFEAEVAEPDVMKHKPRKLDDPLFGSSTMLVGLLQGLLTLIATLGVYLFVIEDHGDESARALAFTTLIICNLGLILANRSASSSILAALARKNSALWWVVGITMALLILTHTWDFAREICKFAPFPLAELFYSLGAAFLVIVVMEIANFKKNTLPLFR